MADQQEKTLTAELQSDHNVPPENNPSWKEVTSTEGGFRVSMPGTPTEGTQQFTSPFGNAVGHFFNFRTKAEYLVGYADYPWPVEGTDRLAAFLTGVRDAGVKSLDGRLLEEKEISFEAHPGLTYKIELGGGYVMNSKILVVKNRLYLLAASTYGKNAPAPVARMYDDAAARFLNSFELTSSSSTQQMLGEVDFLLRSLSGKETVFGVCAAASEPDCKPRATALTINGRAISLPKPEYPPIARQARVEGTVVVKVVLDEEGKVIAAQPISGHPLLLTATVNAARQARFAPLVREGKPVKLVGVIIYNFVAQ